ncbi:hypothetical protein CEE44_03920 [Candidatus Woesearchaeota archaeon B3_Woes]|nr:MAG: hypothetical protein CEE44_03920 [Candidatus Woesearchaeota archaeon B3_Woes]
MRFLKLDITNKEEQKLLSRLKVEGKLKFEGSATPSGDSVKEAIAKNIGKDVKLVVVKNIYTKYGSSSADVLAYAYDDEKKLKELEEVNKKPKGKKEGAPKEGAKPEAPKEEAVKPKPAEEKKEEPKEEEKK